MSHRHVHLDPADLELQEEELRLHHKGMASWSIRSKQIYEWISDVPKRAKILEIGCGSGALAHGLRQHGWKDLTLTDVDDYRSFDDTKALPFSKWNANFHRLPYEDGKFDMVMALQVFEHLENPWQAIREIARVLKPGGLFIMTIPNGFSLRSKWKFCTRGDIDGYAYQNDHVSFLPRAVFMKMIESNFICRSQDWSFPFTKFFGKKIYLPKLTHIKRAFSRKSALTLERIENKNIEADWKVFAQTNPK